MRIRFLLLTTTFLFLTFPSLKTIIAQSSLICTTDGSTDSLGCEEIYRTLDATGPFYVKIYVHAIRKEDGTGGQSQQDIEDALSYLDEAFNPHNIFFVWDCHVNDILDSTLYHDLNDPGASFFDRQDINFHTDGIDIYLFPDHPNAQTGYGRAKGYGSTAFYVGGNMYRSPYGSRVRSHVISHEMGHCLGLLHTHHFHDYDPKTSPQTGYEYVARDNCDTTGDCLCDTEADPNIIGEVTYPDCEWNEIEYDPDSNRFVPSTTNIMSYTHDDCMQSFTEGQGERMRNILDTVSVVKNCLLNEAAYIVTSHTTWDLSNTPGGTKEFYADLIVDSAAKLTVDDDITLRFAKSSKLIVKAGGILELEGKLSALSCSNNNTWKGVEVWGDSEKSQEVVNGVLQQGKLIGRPGAIIENAETAVQLWGPNKYTNSGGIASCHQTIFQNNATGVSFYKYRFSENGNSLDYISQFNKCTFSNDNNFPDDLKFEYFVKMVEVNGPAFTGCSFISDYTPSSPQKIVDYGYGIFALDAGFTVEEDCKTVTSPCSYVTRSKFEGLGYGVYTGHGVDLDAPFKVLKADFSNCFVGIQNRGVTGGTIAFNTFEFGNSPYYASMPATPDQIGIHLSHSNQGMTVEENEFTAVDDGGSNIRTIGITSYSLGETNKQIRRNTFKKMDIANEAAGVCGNKTNVRKGLVYSCNTNENTGQYDFLVFNSESPRDQIREWQFSLDSTGLNKIATRNQFSNTTSASDGDFSNGEADVDIDYYYYLDTPLTKPDSTSGVDQLVNSGINYCEKSICPPPCVPQLTLDSMKAEYADLEGDLLSILEEYEQALNNGDTTTAEELLLEATLYRMSMDKNAHTILVHAMYDTLNWNRDTLRQWYRNMDSYAADLMVAFDYMQMGETEAAASLMNNIGNNFELNAQQILDVEYAQMIMDTISGHPIDELGEEAVALLDSIAQLNSVFSSGRAKNILPLYGVHYPPITSNPQTYGERPVATTEANDHNAKQIVVFPNPAHRQVTFRKLETNNRGFLSVVIVNVNGHRVYKAPWKSLQPSIQWNCSNHPGGLYFYKIMSQNGKLYDSGRIVIR